MPKFRKKPVVIFAEQFFFSDEVWPRGVTMGGCCGPLEQHPHIHTLEGKHIVSDGDWVITGIRGEKYPCKPDIFDATYELVEE